MFQKFQNAILLAPVVENLLELATIAFMLNYSKSFLPVHYERPISGMAFPVADDEGFGQSQIPLPLLPPIKSANCLCFKLSSKLCLNCNLGQHIFVCFDPFLDTSIAGAPHRSTKAVFNFVFFHEGLKFVTCEHFRAVSLQHLGKPMVEHPLQQVIDED